MERKLNHSEQNSGEASLAFMPAACGWRVVKSKGNGESVAKEFSTLSEAVSAAFSPDSELLLEKGNAKPLPATVAIPSRLAVFERLVLPAEDPEELAGMVRLQFEKSLPFPVEETAVGFQVLSKNIFNPSKNEEEVQGLEDPAPAATPITQTTLLASGVHHSAAETLCAPLLAHRFPQRLTVCAMHMAAQAPAGGTACGVWREENDVIFGIFENQRLGFVEILSSTDDVVSALPRIMLSAEMAGAPTTPSIVMLDPSLSALDKSLTAYFGVPLCELSAIGHTLPPGEAVDFTPEAWRLEQARRERFQSRRKQIIAVAALYAAFLLSSLVYLGIQSNRLASMKKEAALLQPRVDTIVTRQARWRTLAPAIDRGRYAVELLFQTCQNLPSVDTRITKFEISPNQLLVEGEALNAQQAISFGEKMKTCPELSGFHFESGQPVILPNEHAQFRIFGKL